MGWEPNPKHEEYLNKMNQAYKSCGFRAHIHTKTGVGATDRVSQFVENIRDVRDWGAHVVDRTGSNIGNTVDPELSRQEIRYGQSPSYQDRIAQYINDIVGTRRLPTTAPGVMKPEKIMFYKAFPTC